MKGIKKCFGLFLVLATMFGLSLNASSGASALKHVYSSLNFTEVTYFYSYNGNNTGMGWALPQYVSMEYPQSNSLSQPNMLGQLIKSAGSPCYESSSSQPTTSNTTNTTNMSMRVSKNAVLPGQSALQGSDLCHSLDRTSFYTFDGFNIARNPNSPNSYSQTFKDLFFYYSPENRSKYVYQFTLPLQYNPSVVGQATQGRPFHFHISFGSVAPFQLSDISGNLSDWSNQRVTLRVRGIYADSSSAPIYNGWATYNRNFTFEDSASGNNYCTNLFTYANGLGLQADCYWTSPYDMDQIVFSVSISPYQESTSDSRNRLYPVWYNESDVFFREFYVVTDNDETPGADASLPITGNTPNASPGYENTTGDNSYDALLNLFNFSAINPFAPLFAMFNDNSGCASIPIIAGMLHAEETTYCPWFSSSTRNILTPVLSIAGIMLLFGFFVRWLSSSSGNMFEDQTTHKWGNTQIGQQKHGKF